MEKARIEAERLRAETEKLKQQSQEYSAQLEKEREKAGVTLPACGLMLMEVLYE